MNIPILVNFQSKYEGRKNGHQLKKIKIAEQKKQKKNYIM